MRHLRTRSRPGFAAPRERANVRGVWACAEGRFGVRGGVRKCWCPCGVRPPWLVHDRDHWRWRSAAVEPATGRRLFRLLPRVTKEWFAAVVEPVGAATAGERVGIVLDGSGSHRADMPWLAHVVPLPLPPESPARTPAEQIVRVQRPTLANRIVATLGELETERPNQRHVFWDQPATRKRLTGYPWWITPIPTMSPNP
jgi:hypothetical protein